MVKTDSFELAVYAQGDENADKLALVLPGLLDTKDYPHMRSHVGYLAGRGYYALSFDPPGTWESGSDIEQYTMSNYLKAIDELIKYSGDKPTVLVGHSLGGLIAALAAARNSNIEAFVSIMAPHALVRTEEGEERAVGRPLTKWREVNLRPSRRDLPGDPAQIKHFDLPYSFVEDSLQYNSLNVPGEVKIQKLFVAGKHDGKIRPEVVKATYEAATDPKQLATLDSDHDYRHHPQIIEEMNQIISEFLGRM